MAHKSYKNINIEKNQEILTAGRRLDLRHEI